MANAPVRIEIEIDEAQKLIAACQYLAEMMEGADDKKLYISLISKITPPLVEAIAASR